MPADFAMAELNFPDREDSIVISESAVLLLENLCETYVTAAQCDNTDDEEETNAGWFLLNSLVKMIPAHKIDFTAPKRRQSKKHLPGELKAIFFNFYNDPKVGDGSVIKVNLYLKQYAPSLFLPFYPAKEGAVPESTADGWVAWAKSQEARAKEPVAASSSKMRGRPAAPPPDKIGKLQSAYRGLTKCFRLLVSFAFLF